MEGQGCDLWNSLRALELRLIRPRMSRTQLAHFALVERVRLRVVRGLAVLALARVAVLVLVRLAVEVDRVWTRPALALAGPARVRLAVARPLVEREPAVAWP